MSYMATIEFQSSNAYFLYPTCHNRPIIIQSHGFGLDMFFGADCQVGIEFFQLLGQDWDWDWPLFYILRTLDWFKVWISVPNAKWTNALKINFHWTSGSRVISFEKRSKTWSPIPPGIESQSQSVKWTRLFWPYFLCFGLLRDFFIWLIWGHHHIVQVRYIGFETKHVTLDQKFVKPLLQLYFWL